MCLTLAESRSATSAVSSGRKVSPQGTWIPVAIVSATASFTGLTGRTGALLDLLAGHFAVEGLASPYPLAHPAANAAVVTSTLSVRVVRMSALIAF
jgi:hypothetical protein